MEIKKVLFPTDFMEGTKDAVPYAVDIAKKYNAKLYLMHVIYEVTKASGLYVPHITLDELYRSMEEEAKNQIQKAYLEETRGFDNLEYVVKKGIPYEEIINFASEEGVDLIVIGTHGRKGLEKLFFGSTAEKVIKHATCPVLTVRVKE
ncbi:MAG: universal stress protein [Nitrospirae bacterium]|nr:MAG: universal stress protein [Nitrospirota bacterium]